VAESGSRRSEIADLLGQPSTNAMLDTACRAVNVRLSAEDPGHDGYIIHIAESGGRQLVLVGGSNARAVIYGQDTLFQMFARADGKLVLGQASIRDWPTVPWRGRPQTHYNHYLEPGAWDCYLPRGSTGSTFVRASTRSRRARSWTSPC